MVQKDTITVLVIIATLCASICYCHPAPAGYNDDDDIETAIQEFFDQNDASVESLLMSALLNLQQQKLVKAASVDPANFKCDESSPVSTPVWSNTNPPVALTHIFCGQINKKGEAEGFHSFSGQQDPPCAKASEERMNTYPLDCYKKIEVYQSTTKKWIPRNYPSTYCFFDEDLSVKDTVKILTEIYNDCKNQRDKDKICYQMNKKVGIVIFTNGVTKGEQIVSAFPVPTQVQSMPCKKYCTPAHIMRG